jgi:hypothetical protein
MHGGLHDDTCRALLGLPLRDPRGASAETRMALLNAGALHLGDLVARFVMREAQAIHGLMRSARALRLDGAEAAQQLGSLCLREVVLSLLRASMGRPLNPEVVEACATLDAEASAVATARAGTKVDRLDEASRRLGALIKGGVLDEFSAHAELMGAAERAGLSVQVSSRIIADGLEAGKLERMSGRAGGFNA